MAEGATVIGTEDGVAQFGAGLMEDEMAPFVPGLNCLSCGRFVDRAGWINIGHFEMSDEIAYVEGECSRCVAADRAAHPDRYGFTATGQTKVIACAPTTSPVGEEGT